MCIFCLAVSICSFRAKNHPSSQIFLWRTLATDLQLRRKSRSHRLPLLYPSPHFHPLFLKKSVKSKERKSPPKNQFPSFDKKYPIFYVFELTQAQSALSGIAQQNYPSLYHSSEHFKQNVSAYEIAAGLDPPPV